MGSILIHVSRRRLFCPDPFKRVNLNVFTLNLLLRPFSMRVRLRLSSWILLVSVRRTRARPYRAGRFPLNINTGKCWLMSKATQVDCCACIWCSTRRSSASARATTTTSQLELSRPAAHVCLLMPPSTPELGRRQASSGLARDRILHFGTECHYMATAACPRRCSTMLLLHCLHGTDTPSGLQPLSREPHQLCLGSISAIEQLVWCNSIKFIDD